MTFSKLLTQSLLLGMLAGGTLPSWAQCEGPSPWVTLWPRNDARLIQPRQRFLVMADASLGTEVRKLGHGTEVYLWAAHDSVSLRVLNQLVNEDGEMQLLLEPSRPLLPNSQYELRTSTNYALFRNSGKAFRTSYRWQVAATADTQPPQWLATPALVEKKYAANSEGLENYVLFSCPLQDSSAYLIKTTILHASSGRKTTFYVLPWRGRLPIGWFTCGGDIRFKSEETYSISFEAIDAAGNRASATGTPITFRAPRKVASPWGY